ncbi:MAG: TM2 domain-containing protein [Lachnospiraceae bacterium]|nr:TM2 domain-containing protein [Lachnospiraceae bacterium]
MDNNNLYQNVNTDERKSKLAAGLLGIFLGAFGVHNFYLGYTKKAILQVALSGGSIVLSIIFWILSIPLSFIVIGVLLMPLAGILDLVPMGIGIWGLVEGIMILAGGINVDGKGISLKE